MIARIWHGSTKAEHFDEYSEFMRRKAADDYQSAEGFVRLVFLHRLDGKIAHFQLITYWENLESVKNFAGDDYESAKYYPEDKNYLLEFEKRVTHFEVFADSTR